MGLRYGATLVVMNGLRFIVERSRSAAGEMEWLEASHEVGGLLILFGALFSDAG